MRDSENKKPDELEAEVKRLLAQYEALPIIASVLTNLEEKLPKALVYHNLAHTLDVMHEALYFGVHDNLRQRELDLLALGAAYHDAGFIERVPDNEVLGAKCAIEAMQSFGGYTQEECKAVQVMIQDTRFVADGSPNNMRQVATTKLSGYLIDADLSNLGREDFLAKYELVRQELGISDTLARPRTRELIKAHDWYTPAARALRQERKLSNLGRF